MKKFTLIGSLLCLLACADLSENMKNLSNGPSGSQGPQGPAGPTGPAGPSGEFAGDRGRLLSGEWKLEAYETGRVNRNTVLEFKTQRNLAGNYILSGISAVNFYEAGYTLSGTQTIKIINLSMTEIGGPPADMAFEKQYFERLVSMSSFSFKDNMLVLRNGKGEEMHFK